MTTTLQEYSFISDADALEISVLRCTPAGRPRAIIQLVHGMAEHKERYMDFMQYLESWDICVCCMIVAVMAKVFAGKMIWAIWAQRKLRH